MDDRLQELEEIYKKQIEEIKEYNHEQLIDKCEIEGLDCKDLDDEQIRTMLIEYYNEDIDE